MTAELRQKIYSKFVEAGIGVLILGVVVYVQRIDVNTLNNKIDRIEQSFVNHLQNDHQQAVKSLDISTALLVRIERYLNDKNDN